MSASRRNALVLGATAATVGVLFLFPTSTNSSSRRTASPAAPVGIVPAQPLASGKAGTPAPATVVVNGSAVDTKYGPVQVQIRVRTGKLVSAVAISYPTDNGRDREINSAAIPALQAATLRAQSAKIDTVSGATYTSNGYRRSLQAALDAAHLR